MSRILSAAALAAVLIGGGLAAVQARDLASTDRIQLAQMNSSGDGIEAPGVGRAGNMRPSRMGGMRMHRHRRARHHRRHR